MKLACPRSRRGSSNRRTAAPTNGISWSVATRRSDAAYAPSKHIRHTRTAESQRVRVNAVAAGVGDGDVAAALGVDVDHLGRAHDRVDGVGDFDLVTAGDQLVGYRLAEAGFEDQRRRGIAAAGCAVGPAGRLDRGLQAQPKVEQAIQQLQAGLRLAVRAAGAECQPRLAIAQREARHQRVQRSLARRQDVGMPGLQGEA